MAVADRRNVVNGGDSYADQASCETAALAANPDITKVEQVVDSGYEPLMYDPPPPPDEVTPERSMED